MLKRIFLILAFMLSFSVIGVHAQGCSFDTYSDSCLRFSSSFDSFNLGFSPTGVYDNYSAEIYSKSNPSNKIKVAIDGNVVRNVNPFQQPGVYVLKVKAYNKGKLAVTKEFEYIFDNLEPMPPVVPLNLYAQGNSLVVNGRTQFANMDVVAEVEGKSSVNTKSDANGDFTITLNVNNGINYVKFYTQSAGINSAIVERIATGGGKIEDNVALASGITITSDLSKINDRTYYNNYVGEYVTSKRNFYVSGTASGTKGAKIYVNGQRAVFDGNKFGAFVLLNEGKNTVVVESGAQKKSIVVNYVSLRFRFLKLDYDKVVSGESFMLKGKVNYDLPFNVYMNGKYVGTVSQFSYNGVDESYNFTYDVTNLIPGKNYLYIEGYNGKMVSDIIYDDVQKPTIKLLSFKNVSDPKRLVFEIKDDIGISTNSAVLNIGGREFKGDQYDVNDNFYIFDISDLSDGHYNYHISVKDLSGKSATLFGVLDVNKSNTVINNFAVANSGYVIGNEIFVKNGEQKLVLYPSRFIAFKKIYLDGKEQTDYKIMPDGRVNLNIDFENSNGTLKLEFINNEYKTFTQVFNYYTDGIKPVLNLDYVYSSDSTQNNTVKITGEIIDNNFNWTSLEFNSQSNVERFGKYFEAFVKLDGQDERNLVVTGQDYAENSFETDFGALLYNDNSKTLVNLKSYAGIEGINGTLEDSKSNQQYNDFRLKNFIYSYDGFDMKKVYLPTTFEIPLQQREGLRSLNMKGFESSAKKFSATNIFTVDTIAPRIYLVNDNGVYKVLVDGTLSSVKSVDVQVNGVPASTSECKEDFFVFSACTVINSKLKDGVNVKVTAKDSAGNVAEKAFTISQDIASIGTMKKISSKLPEIYFSGNDIFTSNPDVVIQGQIRYDGILNSVKLKDNVTGDIVGNCQFDDFNFACPVTLKTGLNNLVVDVNDASATKGIEVTLINTPITVNINSISGTGLYKSGSDYYLDFNTLLDMSANVSKKSLVSVLINGETILSDVKTGNFNLPINISRAVSGKSGSDVNLQLVAKDEYGNKGFSNIFKILYNRIIETFVKVVVK